MNATKLIQLARAKKLESVLGFLKLAFKDFAYPVYLFGSYATGEFHGHSDVDIVIIAPDALAKKVYRQACDQMAELGMNYDILIAPSINRLDSSIVTSLQAINVPVQPHQTSAPPSRHQRGLTLVELMIAMLLGLFLVGGLLQIFISSKQTYRMQEGLSRLQENGRFALDFITRDIRMAGFRGCSSVRQDADNDGIEDFPIIQLKQATPSNFLYQFKTFIEGFEATSTTAWLPAMVADITSPLGGSDVITIRRADEQGFSLAVTVLNPLDGLVLAPGSNANFKSAGFFDSDGNNKCAIAVVSDCTRAIVFQISAIATDTLNHDPGICASPDNLNSDLSGYLPGAQVFPINTISYYVRTANGQASLYRRIGTNDAQELVEGIENMQILYGEDTDADGTANYYVIANAVADWARVVSVRVSLLLATIEDNAASQPLSYTYNGVTVTPADRRIRRVFNSTIAVRNRLQ